MFKNKLFFALFSLIFTCHSLESKACYAYFTFDRACAGDTVWFHPIDLAAVYCWTFDDPGSSANVSFEQEPYHIFSTPGTYYVTLFTNVGAEWDYYTTVVEVTSNCFLADFTWDCSGPLQIQFEDYSVGHPVSWSWTFGDPASGANDTSNLENPTHSFSAPGSYSVELIVSDGLQADTVMYTINAFSSCIDAFFGQTLILPCFGDTFNPSVNYYGSVTGYSWNFGDPGSGTSDTATSAHPIHVYWAPGMYTITLVITDGLMYDTTYLYVEVVDCRIWPGDVNRDGTVDGDDIFGIGIYSGATGPVRTGATSSFVPQTCDDWPGMSGMMYLTDFLNAKYADCDGNGVINGNDVAVVVNNMGGTAWVENNQSAMLQVPESAPELGFAYDTIDGWSGATIEAPIELGITDSAKRIYGFSLTVAYDPFMVSYTSADFIFSWLGGQGVSMYTAVSDDPANGLVHIAAVRNTKTTVSGKGEIVRLYVHGFGYSGYSPLEILPTAKVITNGMYPAINNQMVVVPVEISNTTLNFIVGVEEYEKQEARIYPNPADESVTIDVNGSEIRRIEIIDVMGRVVFSNETIVRAFEKIDVTELSEGMYTLRAITDQGLYMGRFMKQ